MPRCSWSELSSLQVEAEEAKDPNTAWKPAKIAKWYGEREREVEIASATAVWHSTGLFAVPVRWVLVCDPQKEFKTQRPSSCVPTLMPIRRRSSVGL